jgi:hypothetical protein
MKPVGGVGGTQAIHIGTSRPSVQPLVPDTKAKDSTDKDSTNTNNVRALVPVASVGAAREAPSPGQRSQADFLAHLIATAGQLPQTRERRRADPQDAVAAYAATAAGVSPGPYQRFSRES